MKNQNHSELDIGLIPIMIRKDWWIFFLLFFISIFFSVFMLKTLPVTYSAVVVFEEFNNQEKESRGLVEDQLPAFLALESFQGSESNFAPRAMGRDFLQILLKDPFVKNYMDKNCIYSAPSRFSAINILQFLGRIGPPDISYEQQEEIKIDCMRSFITVEPYQPENIKNTKISRILALVVKTGDPDFSAYFANLVFKNYIEVMGKERLKDFEQTMVVLSSTVAKAQIKANTAEKKLENFMIENSKFFKDFDPSLQAYGGSGSLNSSLDRTVMQVSDIGDLETKIEKFKIVLKLIKNLQIHSIKMRFYFRSQNFHQKICQIIFGLNIEKLKKKRTKT